MEGTPLMSLTEPLPSQSPRGTNRNLYQGRWRFWYSAIADEMLRDPKVSVTQIAKNLGRSVSTISYIVNTDLFRDYYAKRRAEFSRQHDDSIRQKLLGVTEASLDILSSQLKTKQDQVPIKLVAEIATGMLEKLGYGAPQAPQVVVNNTSDNSTKQVVVTQASLSELEQARQALQLAEARQIGLTPTLSEPARVVDVHDVEQLMEDRQGASSE